MAGEDTQNVKIRFTGDATDLDKQLEVARTALAELGITADTTRNKFYRLGDSTRSAADIWAKGSLNTRQLADAQSLLAMRLHQSGAELQSFTSVNARSQSQLENDSRRQADREARLIRQAAHRQQIQENVDRRLSLSAQQTATARIRAETLASNQTSINEARRIRALTASETSSRRHAAELQRLRLSEAQELTRQTRARELAATASVRSAERIALAQERAQARIRAAEERTEQARLNALNRQSSASSGNSSGHGVMDMTVMTATYMGIASLITALKNLVVSIPTLGDKFQQANSALAATYKNSALVTDNLAFLDDLANRAGVRVDSLRESFAKFAASGTRSGFTVAEVNKQFEHYVIAAKSLNMSNTDLQLALTAVTQIMSKGKVTAEELQGQLGEHIPAAVQIMADSLGVGSAELRKQMEDGKVTTEVLQKFSEVLMNEYISGFASASQTLTSQTNRLANAWDDLAITVFQQSESALVSVVDFATESIKWLEHLAETSDDVKASFKDLQGTTQSFADFGKDGWLDELAQASDRYNNNKAVSTVGIFEYAAQNIAANGAILAKKQDEFFASLTGGIPKAALDFGAIEETALKTEEAITQSVRIIKEGTESAKVALRDNLAAGIQSYVQQANIAFNDLQIQQARIDAIKSDGGIVFKAESDELEARKKTYQTLEITLAKLVGTYQGVNNVVEEGKKARELEINKKSEKARLENEEYQRNKKLADSLSVKVGVDRKHADTLKSVVESLNAQHLEFDKGKNHLEYYRLRLQGLNEEEARLAINLQTNSAFLKERLRLESEGNSINKGIKTQYLESLKAQGIEPTSQDFSVAESEAKSSLQWAKTYEESLKSLEVQAEATQKGLKEILSAPIGEVASGNAQAFIKAIQKAGESYETAVAIAANIKQESGFDHTRVGDTGAAYGLGQWHAPRQKTFAKVFGKDIRQSTMEEQIQFLLYELRKGGEDPLSRKAGRLMDSTSSIPEKAAYFSEYYERPLATEKEKALRSRLALELAGKTSQAAKETTAHYKDQEVSLNKSIELSAIYGGQLHQVSVTAQDIESLGLKKMSNETDSLIGKAQTAETTYSLWGKALRDAELTLQEFDETQRSAILQAEGSAAYAQELRKLDEESLNTSKDQLGLAESYRKELERTVIPAERIGELVGKKVTNAYRQDYSAALQRNRQLSVTEKQWQRIQYTVKGYNEEQIKSLENLQKQNELLELSTQMRDGLVDAFRNSIAEGEDLFSSFGGWLEEQFSQLVLKPSLDGLVTTITDKISSVLGSFSQAMSGAFASPNGFGQGLASFGQSIGVDWFSGAGATSNAMYGSTSAIAGLLGGQIFGGQGGMGASIGSAIGTAVAGPLGTAAGGLLGGFVGGLFGGKKETTDTGAYLKYSHENGVSGSTYTAWKKKGGLFSSTKRGEELQDLPDEVLARLSTFFKDTEKALIDSAEYLGYDTYQQIIDSFDSGSSKVSGGKDGSSLDSAITDWANGVRADLYQAIFANDFADLMEVGEDSATGMSRLVTQMRGVLPVLENLNFSYRLSVVDAAGLADTLVELSGSLETFQANTSAYYSGAYTKEEQLSRQFATGARTLAEFNQAHHTSISKMADLRSYVEGLDLTTEAGQKAFTAAMELAPALNSMVEAQQAYYDSLESVKSALDSMIYGDLSIFKGTKKQEMTEKELDALYQKAQGGDLSAIQEFSTQSQSYLQLMRSMYSSSDQYTAAYSVIMAQLTELNSLYSDPANGLNLAGSAESLGSIDFSAKSTATDVEALKSTSESQLTELKSMVDILKKTFGAMSDTVTLGKVAEAQRETGLSLTANLTQSLEDLATALSSKNLLSSS